MTSSTFRGKRRFLSGDRSGCGNSESEASRRLSDLELDLSPRRLFANQRGCLVEDIPSRGIGWLEESASQS